MLRGIFKATKTAIILSIRVVLNLKAWSCFIVLNLKWKPPHQNRAVAKTSILRHFKAITIAPIAC